MFRVVTALVLCALVALGCDDDALQPAAVDGGKLAGGLTAQQAQAVVARVGDVTITLGDFAAALERMNQFDRLRYQTKERRRELLQELIEVELLAQEARRRGLDQKPEVQERIRQVLREAMQAEARSDVPPPAGYSAAEVQAYYEAHADEFREPERRRVSAIVLDDAAQAAEVLAKALDTAKASNSGEAWGELYYAHSVDAPKERNPNAPADLSGDLGIVGPPGDPKGASASVPEPVRTAVFGVDQVGEIYPRVVGAGGKHYIVRLAGVSKGHTRSLEEAERMIRVALMQQRQQAKLEALEADLRKRHRVVIDDKALAEVQLPKALERYKPFWEEGAGAGGADGAPDDQ